MSNIIIGASSRLEVGTPELAATCMNSHIHYNHRCLCISSKPFIFPFHIFYPPSPFPTITGSRCAPAHNMSAPALPTTSHASTHATGRTGSYVLMFPSALRSSPLCVVFPPAGVTHERPLLRHPALFDLTWSFMETGCPEHFTFPSVVQQMCSNGTQDRLEVGESLHERHCYQLWSLFFFFSLHVNLHVFTSTLLHRQDDS